MSQDPTMAAVSTAVKLVYDVVSFIIEQRRKSITEMQKELDNYKKENNDLRRDYMNNPKTIEYQEKIKENEAKITDLEKKISATDKALDDTNKLKKAMSEQMLEYEGMKKLDMGNLTPDQEEKFNTMRQEYIGSMLTNLRDQGVTKEQFDGYMRDPEGADPELKEKIAQAKLNAGMDKVERDILAKPEYADLSMKPSDLLNGLKPLQSEFHEKIEAAMRKGAVSQDDVNRDVSQALGARNNDAPAL